MSQLPVDVIVEIFSRLPVKTLLRFRRVSKQFLSIIDGENFVKRHLQYHSLRQKIIFLDLDMELFSLDLDLVDIACKLEIPFKDWLQSNDFEIIGSCDGMLALRNFSDYSIGIWNISTRRHHILPHCLSSYNHCFHDCNCAVVDGFGRDPNSNDYKIIRIIQLPNVTEVNNYSLEANCWKVIDCLPPHNCWKVFDSLPPDSYYWLSSDVAFVEGTLNWLGQSRADNVSKYFILSYDLKNETLSEILLDSIQNIQNNCACNPDLMVLCGCLCLVFCDRLGRPYDIWVMKEYGSKDSWVKIYSFSASGLVPDHMLGFSNSGDQMICVIEVDNDKKVMCLDLKSGRYEIKSGSLPPTRILTVVAYVESLVSLPNVNN